MFVELAARTNFSLLRGGSSPKAIVKRAAELGYDAIGIADCDGLYGMVRALDAATDAGIRLIVGCELAIDSSPVSFLWIHVATQEGYANLCRILTESHERHPKRRRHSSKQPFDPEVISRVDAARNQFAGIDVRRICDLAAGLWCLSPVPEDDRSVERRETIESLSLLKEAFGGRFSLAVWKHFDGEDERRLLRTEFMGRKIHAVICATNRVLFARPEDKPILDVLHCVREGFSLDAAGRRLLPNTEAHLKSTSQMGDIFGGRTAWLERACEIADACRFSMRELDYKFPDKHESQTITSSRSPDEALRQLTYDGARIRYPDVVPDSVCAQLEKELALIAKMAVASYFLSVYAIVEMARKRDILCQGRGSAANSAVCYCLGITAVDPSRSNLLFERFLSAERQEPPDIDVDFEHERREEVIQAIYETYGRDRAAMVCEVISYRGKSALRDVGKVFGLSLEQVDRLSGLVSWWDSVGEVPPARLRASGFDPNDKQVRQAIALAQAIQGYPRHLSIHVGGFVLSAEPLVHIAPIEPAAMAGRTIIPWDKDDLDTLGFFKVDVLGLGMLTVLRKALAMVNHDTRIAASTAIERLARIPPEEQGVYDALCEADTVGVFQIESRAQMAMLPRLRPRTFYDLVVEVAIVRPGPIQGGMVHPYLRRRTGEEKVDIVHPRLTSILDRTLGVPLFQEQVMQIAIEGAGYSGGEADQLRRDMAAWRRNGRLEMHRERLLEGFARHGIAREFGERLYESIKGFGEYGFPESHAASFAHLVYASAWLKVHHPAVFAAALINSQPMGFYSPGSIVQDAERHGVTVLPIRVDASDWDCTIEGGREGEHGSPSLRLGLRLVKGLGEKTGRRIERARREAGFSSVEQMIAKTGIDRRDVDVLAEAGALAGFGLRRREAMWKARGPRQRDLLAGVELGDEMPELAPMSRAEQLVLDYTSTGVAVGDHAMKVARSSLPSKFKSAREIASLPHGSNVTTAGLVICRQRPETASGVVFVTLEDETGFINLILWAKTFERWRQVVVASSLLAAHGKIETQGQVVYVVPNRLERLDLYDIPAMSRDFH